MKIHVKFLFLFSFLMIDKICVQWERNDKLEM